MIIKQHKLMRFQLKFIINKGLRRAVVTILHNINISYGGYAYVKAL